MQTIKFNTGREYTEHGQRIIATQLDSGHIVMLDIDRHVDMLLLPGVGFNQAEIMQAYDRAWQDFPESINMSYGEYYALLDALRAA